MCTTWQVEDKNYYLLDVERRRLDYPALKALAIKMAELYKPTKLLIEDAGIGTALIQELRPKGLWVVAVKPEGDKVTRMSARSVKFEAGQVWLPERARWLAEFEAELFSFPHAKHDDQVDSVSQALGHYFGFTLDNV